MSGLASSPDVRAVSSLSGQLSEIATGCCQPRAAVHEDILKGTLASHAEHARNI